MEAREIVRLVENPQEGWSSIYKIRDEAGVQDIVTALATNTNTSTRNRLCYILNLRARAEFFEGLASETKQAVPALIALLTDEEVRAEALDALAHIADPAAGPALFALYHQHKHDTSFHGLLATALGACRYTPAIPTLIVALTSADAGLRLQATWGLRHLYSPAAKEALQTALALETEPYTRKVMQETLQACMNPSTQQEKIDTLITQLKYGNAVGRKNATQALGDMIDEYALVSLLPLLQHERPKVRQAAAVALAWMRDSRDVDWFARRHKDRVTAPLLAALQDSNSSVRAAVVQALGEWGDERAVEPLLRLIQDNEVKVRTQVVEALAYLGDERVIEPLLHVLLTDESEEARQYAAQGLGKWPDRRAVDVLIHALQDEQPHVREDAASLLSWLSDERALDALEDAEQGVREWTIEALWSLCKKGLSLDGCQRLQNAMPRLLRDEHTEARERAADILAWLDAS